MNVLVVAEGKHELGSDPTAGEGALAILVRRLLSSDHAPRFERLHRNDIHASHGKGRGYFKKAVRWMLQAQKEGCGALILVVDEDGNRDRLREIDDAQVSSKASIPRALGVAIQTFDAWMRADEAALGEALGSNVPPVTAPEKLVDPKADCRRLLEKSSSACSLSDVYARTARRVDLDLLRRRCPRGFGPFAQRVQALKPGATDKS